MDSAISMDYCKDVLPIPQFEGTCWFNSLLMAIFYSELMRNFFISELPNIKERLVKHPKVMEILEDLLFNNYRINEKNNQHFYNAFRPENILKELNKADKKIFFADDTIIESGFQGKLYVDQMFKFLNVKEKVLYLDITSEHRYRLTHKNADVIGYEIDKEGFITVHYEQFSKIPRSNPYWKFRALNKTSVYEFKTTKRYNMPEDIDVINLNMINTSAAPPEVLQFKNSRFVLDSMMIGNFNFESCKMGHEIAGITCKSKKYLYNGWTGKTNDPALKIKVDELYDAIQEKEKELQTFKKQFSWKGLVSKKERQNKDNALNNIHDELSDLEDEFMVQMKLYQREKPCNLVRYDWGTDDKNFCIDTEKCEYPKRSSESDLCFNVKMGPRSYMYVRDKFKDMDRASAIQSYKKLPEKPSTPKKPEKKECPPEKILNPKTNQCVSRTGVVGKKLLVEAEAKKPSPPKRKECPPEKILNPKTNQCVSRTGVVGKKLLVEAEAKKPSPSKRKECPPEKILNPKTNQCVSRTGVVGKKLVKGQ